MSDIYRARTPFTDTRNLPFPNNEHSAIVTKPASQTTTQMNAPNAMVLLSRPLLTDIMMSLLTTLSVLGKCQRECSAFERLV